MASIYPCIESTIEFVAAGELYRLWINKTEVKFEYPEDREYVEKIQAFCRNRILEPISYLHPKKPISTEEIVEFISKLPNVNAVQIKDKGFPEEGVVVYFVNFENDPHG